MGHVGCGGEEGGLAGWGNNGGSCFDLSEICAVTKTTEISMPALPPTRPVLALARQLNPSYCVPHSCMDLSAMRQGQLGGR